MRIYLVLQCFKLATQHFLFHLFVLDNALFQFIYKFLPNCKQAYYY